MSRRFTRTHLPTASTKEIVVVTCPACQAQIKESQFERHYRVCPKRPQIWAAILDMFREHGYISYDTWNQVRPEGIPSVSVIRRAFGPWADFIHAVMEDVSLDLPLQVRRGMGISDAIPHFVRQGICQCGQPAIVIVSFKMGIQSRGALGLCPACWQMWQQDEEPEGWVVIGWLNDKGGQSDGHAR